MGNHNIEIVDPKGGKKLVFPEDVLLQECKEWLSEYRPAPIGWHYNIVNHNKKPRKYPDYVMMLGFDPDGKLVDERKARVRTNHGRWYTPRMAKRDARAQGASFFIRQKVFLNGKGQDHS